MRIPSGTTDQVIYFVAVDATDLKTRKTGLTTFTVYRSRNTTTATAMTTPTVTEVDATNMPGVYTLLLDEDMTIGSGNDSEEMVFHITQASMAPVTRTIELYRPKITAGNTLDVTATGAAGIDWGNVENAGASVDLSATAINLCDTVTTNTDMVSEPPTAAANADAVWDEVLTAATHNVATSAGRRLRTLQVGGNYENGAIWVDTVNGTAGTTADENGTVTNPVDSIADALTLGTATNLRKIAFYPGSSITLAATVDGYEFYGADTPIALGGQSIAGCRFFDCEVTGISTGSAEFYRCKMGAATIAPGTLRDCGIGYSTGTLTFGSAGNFDLVNSHSLVAGAGSPVIDMGAAVGATNLGIRNHHGGLTLNNLATGDVVTIGGLDLGTITLNGADAQVEIRGIKKATTNNLTGSPTVNDTALLKSDIDAILVDTAEIGAAGAGLTDLGGMSTAMKAEVNAEVDGALDTAIPGTPTAGSVNDVLSDLSAALPASGTLLDDTTTFAEPSSIPAATATIPDKIGLMAAIARNKATQTATTYTLRNDADSANIGTATVSDDGTTFTRGELG